MYNPNIYTIGWICALPLEYIAAQVFLDETNPAPTTKNPQDRNTYTLGQIGQHNIVIAVLPIDKYGTVSAAGVARDMVRSFPNVRVGLMVGIGGGAPSAKDDIRLGDVVVGSSVLKTGQGVNAQRKGFEVTAPLVRPPGVMWNEALERHPRLKRDYSRQPPQNDPAAKRGGLFSRKPKPALHPARPHQNPVIHYGIIASSNTLMKHAPRRDELIRKHDVVCFEMEASGLTGHFPCLAIRGICDYSDKSKEKSWQGYAAMVAAAYARDLMSGLPAQGVLAERRMGDSVRL